MITTANIRPDNERLIGLELLRFLAAIAVLVWHYQHFMFTGHEQSSLDGSRLPLLWPFAPLYAYGYSGVQLFWCISGFIFTWKYAGVIGRGGLSFRRFVMLRFSRLYPLHLVTLLFVAALQWMYFARHGQAFVYLFNDVPHFVMNVFFANWWGFQSGESFNGPSWSVSAEIVIYVAFFWITLHAGSKWQVDLLVMCGFAIAAPIAKALFEVKLAFSGPGTFFYLGALTYHLYEWIDALGYRSRLCAAWVCAVIIAVSATLVNTHLQKIAGASLLLFPATVLFVQFAVRPRRAEARRLLIGLGNLTYASYMLHFPIQLAIMLILGAVSVQIQLLFYSGWFMLAYLGIVLAAASRSFAGLSDRSRPFFVSQTQWA